MTVATIYIDNEPREADSSQNLLHVLLSLGYDLPYFCWHPALGSVGACRQCAVKQFRNEQDTSGKLIMACMTPALDGTRVSIQDSDAAEFRAAVIQGLMQNHPHDCPVCDEGGECHLQDMTVMTGHCARHYSFSKRTFRNQYLGPLINHEMNRCIQCQRCVRYYREYAGGHDLNAFRLRDVVYFGRFEDGVLENEFAGNLVEICPTGVFTDATLKRHYTRKWDLQMAPSICVHCAAGCNTSVGERYGSLRRVINRYNHEVNGYFLCDRGRFGYEFVNSEQRIEECLLNGAPVDAAQAASHLEALIETGSCIGIGSPRASLESNFALRQLVGSNNFYAGVADDELSVTLRALELLQNGPAKSPSLDEIGHSDAVFIVGEDVTNVLPLMALRLRQSARQQPIEKAKQAKIPLWLDHAVRELLQDEKGPFFIAAPYATRLDDIATEVYRAAPDDLARLCFAVAEAINSGASDDLAGRIAVALRSAKSPLVVSGTSCRSMAVVEAAAQVASALVTAGRPAKLAYCFAECNSVGLALLGARSLSEALSATAETVIVLENDLYRRAPISDVDAFLNSARHVVVLDHLANPTTAKAELMFPAGTFAETDGTLVNYEGRAQRFFQAFVPSGEIRASWHWLSRQDAHLDDIVSAIASGIPALAGIRHAAPSRKESGKIAREPGRYSGRTSMLANISVHEPKPPDDPDSALAFSMESGPQAAPPPLIPFFWSPGWNSIQSVNKFQSEIGGHLTGGDPGMRLIEPASQPARPQTPAIPPAFHPDAANFLVLPAFHIFGSEELSSRAPAVASLAPAPYVAINPADSAQLGSDATLAGLPVSLRPDIPRGVAVVSSSNSTPAAVELAPAAEVSK
ncbi:MAG TPA: NADH-quinone oxidoreductase subunit NuoG [Bryobacteraceae bacterium]|nr:NADH-quinone oxidoreductase subunit NuoG [Bryobacteraceae bacterium]